MKKYTLYKSTYHFAFCVRCPCKIKLRNTIMWKEME